MADTTNATLDLSPEVEILTPRLRLRTLRVKDTPLLFPVFSNKDVMRYTRRGTASNMEQAESRIKTLTLGPDIFQFLVELRQPSPAGEPVVIGTTGSYHWPEIGYLFHSDHHGKGYATEAVSALLPALFERMPPASEGGTGHDYIEAGVDVENVASQRVLQKCGLTMCERREVGYENTSLGETRNAFIYRVARPGKTLEELGLLPGTEPEGMDERPVPPIQ